MNQEDHASLLGHPGLSGAGIEAPGRAKRVAGTTALLILGAVFVAGSWVMALEPDLPAEGRQAVRAEFFGTAVGIILLGVASLALASFARTEKVQRPAAVLLLAVVAGVGAVSTAVITTVAPGAWKLAGILPAAATVLVCAMAVKAARSPWASDPGEPVGKLASSRWRPLSLRLRRVLPVPLVFAVATFALLATMTVLPERGGDWVLLPGLMSFTSALVLVVNVAMAVVPDDRLQWYRTMAWPGTLALPTIIAVGVTSQLIRTGDVMTMACGLVVVAWLASHVIVTVEARRREAPASI